jgi:type I restriction enzyme S subunit
MSSELSTASDYTIRPLGDFFDIVKVRSDASLPIYSVTLRDGMQRRDELGRIIQSDLKSEDNLFAAKNDVCYNMMRMWQGACGLAPENCHVSPAYVVCRPKEGLDPRFAAYLLKSEQALKQFIDKSQGVTSDRWRLYPEEFAKIRLPIPPLPEQKKIAEILSGIDTVIWNHKARAKKCEELIAATEERTFEVFRKDDLGQQDRAGRNAKEVIALGDIFEFRNGLNYSKANTGRGLKVVGVGDFKNYRTPKYESLGELSPEGLDFDLSLLQEGDFLFVRSNGNRLLIGRCLSIEKIPTGAPVVHSGFTIRARPRNQHAYSNDYIKQLLQSRIFRRSVAELGGGTNISNLSQDILSETMIALPSIQRQEKESSGLLAIQGFYEHTQNKVIRLEAMKVAVSSDLLSGRKRVTV